VFDVGALDPVAVAGAKEIDALCRDAGIPLLVVKGLREWRGDTNA